MAHEEFLKVFTLVYESDELDELIGESNAKSYKRSVIVPFNAIYFCQEGLDKRETEIILYTGEVIVALEKIAVIEEKWHNWYNKNHSMQFYNKFN